MIFQWLWKALRFVLRLAIPPPQKKAARKIDVTKERCPACGNVGSVVVEHIVVTPNPGKGEVSRRPLMLFTCATCKAYWQRNPLYTTDKLSGGRPVGADEVGGREIRGIAR